MKRICYDVLNIKTKVQKLMYENVGSDLFIKLLSLSLIINLCLNDRVLISSDTNFNYFN